MPPAIRIALTGIALSTAVMILSVAIITGFKREVRNKVLGFGSHIHITRLDSNSSYETLPITVGDSLVGLLRSHRGVRHVEAFATKPGILKTDTDFQGIVLKGVDRDYDWDFLGSHLREGRLPEILPGEVSNEVLVSQYIANLLRLSTGERILCYFVQDEVRARKFTIAGLYETGFVDYDKLFVIGDIRHIRRLNGWNSQQASGLELLLHRYDEAERLVEDLYPILPPAKDDEPLYVRSIQELNPMIFGWLEILNTNVAVILILMLAVAGFTMISGLLIILFERIRMIGMLKALGQENRSIRKVFLYVSLFLTGRGMFWGNLTGLGLCLLQDSFHLFRLDPATYYLEAVPIDLSPWPLVALNLGVFLAIQAMTLAPTRLISNIQPAQTIHFL